MVKLNKKLLINIAYIMSVLLFGTVLVFAREMVGVDGAFIAFNDRTVLDTRTNLMWAAKDNGADIDWAGAKSYCEKYQGAGYRDWRMPTQSELLELADKRYDQACGLLEENWTGTYRCCITPLIDVTGFRIWAMETRGSEAAFVNAQFSGFEVWGPRSDYDMKRALPVRFNR